MLYDSNCLKDFSGTWIGNKTGYSTVSDENGLSGVLRNPGSAWYYWRECDKLNDIEAAVW